MTPGPLPHSLLWVFWVALCAWSSPAVAAAAPAAPARSQTPAFQLPTANRALFEPADQQKFFAGTVGKPWTSGTFGCVRSEGRQFHEGLDIRCLERDAAGEPRDAVRATADGTVAYINRKPSLSNYGNYLVLRHRVEGVELFSLYAHLRAIEPGLAVESAVAAGARIGSMGRTSNTRQAISKDRAHVHFELNFLVNDRFPAWFPRHFAGQRNDHGLWNGHNLLGLDPRQLFLDQASEGNRFSLVAWLQRQPELCRVLLRGRRLSWAQRCAPLVARNPTAEREGIAAYEVSFNHYGLPFRFVPRAASEISPGPAVKLLSVNTEEFQRHACRRLVSRTGTGWTLTPYGQRLADLLVF